MFMGRLLSADPSQIVNILFSVSSEAVKPFQVVYTIFSDLEYLSFVPLPRLIPVSFSSTNKKSKSLEGAPGTPILREIDQFQKGHVPQILGRVFNGYKKPLRGLA
jgi:hypothetical protein